MNALIILIPLALLLGLLGLAGFLWALRARQYDDLDGAAARILFDDDSRGRAPARPAEPRAETKERTP
jgi:cbb3-type cytochrome oxidase maturation protein